MPFGFLFCTFCNSASALAIMSLAISMVSCSFPSLSSIRASQPSLSGACSNCGTLFSSTGILDIALPVSVVGAGVPFSAGTVPISDESVLISPVCVPETEFCVPVASFCETGVTGCPLSSDTILSSSSLVNRLTLWPATGVSVYTSYRPSASASEVIEPLTGCPSTLSVKTSSSLYGGMLARSASFCCWYCASLPRFVALAIC